MEKTEMVCQGVVENSKIFENSPENPENSELVTALEIQLNGTQTTQSTYKKHFFDFNMEYPLNP